MADEPQNGTDEQAGGFAYDAFVSHATADKKDVDRIVASLESQSIRCWVAPRDMRPGIEYGAEIINGVKSSKTLIVLLSKVSVTSRHVRAEVERAVTLGRTVYPVRLEDVELGEALEFFLSIRQRIDLFNDPTGRNLKILANAIASNAAPEHVAVKSARPAWMNWAMPTAIAAAVIFTLSLVFDFFSTQLTMRQVSQQVEQAQKAAEAQLGAIKEKSKPDLSKLKFAANPWGRDSFQVTIDGSEANVHAYDIRAYFEVDGEASSRGAGSFQTDGTFQKAEFLVENTDGEIIARRDVSKEVREALGVSIADAFADEEDRREAWQCTIGGCQVKTNGNTSLCSPLVENVSVRNNENGRWQSLERDCSGVDLGMPLCFNYDDFPFDLDPSAGFEVQINISTGQSATVNLTLDPDWLRYVLRDRMDDPSFEHWIKLTPVQQKNPPGSTPVALLAYQPDRTTIGGFRMVSGLQGCNDKGQSNIANDGWLVDEDGMGLVRQGRNLTFGPANRQPNEGEIASLTKGKREISIAAELENGERLGPYWYTVDPMDAVKLAALRDEATVNCQLQSFGRPRQWVCAPVSKIGWVGAERVEFGSTLGSLSEVFEIDYTAEEFLGKKCAYNQTDCEPFMFFVPDGWENVYYRVTDRTGKSSTIERVVLQR